LIQKNQKIKSANRLLCRTGPLPCKSGKTGAGIYCGQAAQRPVRCKNPYALPRACPPLFYLISPEAYLLTGCSVANKLF